MKILFSSFTCEDIDVAIVTNMISQLQESFPLRRAAGSFEKKLSFMYEFHQYLEKTEHYMAAWGYDFTFECWKYLSRVSEANLWEIHSHVKDKNSIFTARDEDMIF